MSLNNFKTNLKGIKNDVKQFGRQKEFDSEEELIENYKHDLKVAIKALSYIAKHFSKQSKDYWLKYFNSNLKVTAFFTDLIGRDGLRFPDIEELDRAIDEAISQGAYDKIHPKEKNMTSSSLNAEVQGYYNLLSQLKYQTMNEWENFAAHLDLRIKEMNKHLKQFLKIIKERELKKIEYEDCVMKLRKLNKTTTAKNTNENEIKSFEAKEAKTKYDFDKVNNKVVTLLPHGFSILEEFIDSITKYIICRQCDTFRRVASQFREFSIYHGYSHSDRISLEEITSSYDESDNRIRKLSNHRFATDSEEPTHHSIHSMTKKGSTMMGKVASSTTNFKTRIQPKDHTNGLFNGYLAADVLESFERFKDPHHNKAQIYERRIIDASDLHVPDIATNPGNFPRLPPRSNTASTIMKSSSDENKSSFADYSTTFSEFNDTKGSSDDSEINDTTSLSSVSSVSSETYEFRNHDGKNDYDYITSKITAFYNIFKNQIDHTPIHSHSKEFDTKVFKLNVDHESTSLQLESIRERFAQLSGTNRAKKSCMVSANFQGQRLGDLSVKAGDKVTVLMDLQKEVVSFNDDGENWSLCEHQDSSLPRIGFVPNSYLEKS